MNKTCFHFFFVLVLTITSAYSQDLAFKVIALKGKAFYGDSVKGASTPLATGMELPVGSVIKTEANTDLMLQQKATFNIFQVKEKSVMRVDKSKLIAPGELETVVYMLKGITLFNAAKVKGNGKFELDSPMAVGSVRGTQGYVAIITGAPFTPSRVAGVTKGTTLIVFTSQGTVVWSAKNGVLSYKEVVDTAKGMKIPKSVVKTLFEMAAAGAMNNINKNQAFLFIPEDAVDKDLEWAEPEMTEFATLINSLNEAGFFQNPPNFQPFVPPGQQQDSQNSQFPNNQSTSPVNP
ncbi:MAG: hypothetical protein SGI98_08510 [Verrucomicrobiota bacterium]|nr:hypothetical protein [Verrucomicrobiota bacterium]